MQARKTTAILIRVMFCLAVASAVAQTAPPTTTTSLTPEERASALQQFQATRDNFLKSICRALAEAVDIQICPGPLVSSGGSRTYHCLRSDDFRPCAEDDAVPCDSGETRAGEGERSIDSGEDARPQPQGAGARDASSHGPLGHAGGVDQDI